MKIYHSHTLYTYYYIITLKSGPRPYARYIMLLCAATTLLIIINPCALCVPISAETRRDLAITSYRNIT